MKDARRRSEQAYRRTIAQWLAKEGPFTLHDDDPVTIQEVLAGYLQFAVKYYRFTDKHNGAHVNIKQAIGTVNGLYASLPAAQFGPST